MKSSSSPFEIKAIRRNTGTAPVDHWTINKFNDHTYFNKSASMYSNSGLSIYYDSGDVRNTMPSIRLSPSLSVFYNNTIKLGFPNEEGSSDNTNGNEGGLSINYKDIQLAPWTVFNFNYNDGNEDEDDDRIPKFIGKINVEDVEFIGSGTTDKTIVEWD